MSKQEVILCESLEVSLGRAIEKCPHDRLFILTDEQTHRLCMPQMREVSFLKDAIEITIGAGGDDSGRNSVLVCCLFKSNRGESVFCSFTGYECCQNRSGRTDPD